MEGRPGWAGEICPDAVEAEVQVFSEPALLPRQVDGVAMEQEDQGQG